MHFVCIGFVYINRKKSQKANVNQDEITMLKNEMRNAIKEITLETAAEIYEPLIANIESHYSEKMSSLEKNTEELISLIVEDYEERVAGLKCK